MTSLFIIGAGGHGSEVACYIREMERDGEIKLLGFVDDGKQPGPLAGSTVVGPIDALPQLLESSEQTKYITALGNNLLRRKTVAKIEDLRLSSLHPHSVVATSAWLGHDNEIGPGTCVAPGAVITTRVRVGRHCIINMKASLAHDTVVGDYCNINPSATICGNVTLGEGCYIGAGATIIEKCTIGAWTIVGAGSVVTQDLPEGVTAVGVPARIIKRQGVPLA